MAALHANEMVNIKARCETLHDVELNQQVKYEEKEERLGKTLRDANYKGCPLFLAIEDGSGKFEKDVHVVINPRVKHQAT